MRARRVENTARMHEKGGNAQGPVRAGGSAPDRAGLAIGALGQLEPGRPDLDGGVGDGDLLHAANPTEGV